MKTLFVNATSRNESRTLVLAKEVLEKIGGEIEEVKLYDLDLKPFNNEMVNKRFKLAKEGEFDNEIFALSKQFRDADNIVIAAPVWDLSFPSILKIYVEHINATGVLFKYTEHGIVGLANAKKLIYVTTSGGAKVLDFGYKYIEALAKVMYGINDVKYFYAEGLDVWGNDFDKILANTIKEIKEYFE